MHVEDYNDENVDMEVDDDVELHEDEGEAHGYGANEQADEFE